MTNTFRPMRVPVPGLLGDDALQQQLEIFSKQQRDMQTAAPPPDSAVSFADAIRKKYLDEGFQHIQGSVPRRPAPAQLDSTPASRFNEQTARIEKNSSGLAQGAMDLFRMTPGGFFIGETVLDPIVEEGTLSREEAQAEAAKRLEDAKLQEQAAQTKADVRAKLRGLSDEDAARMGMPVAPGGSTPEGQQQGAAFDQRMLQTAQERTNAAKQTVADGAKQLTQEWWLNAMQVGARSAALTGTSMLQYPLAWYEMQAAAVRGQAERSEARVWLETVDAAITKMLPGDKARSKDFLTELSSGAGSMTAFMLAGYVGAAAGLPMAAGTAAAGASAQGTQMYKDAEQHGATGLQKFVALIAGSGLGMTEAIPIDRMLFRADQFYGGAVRRALVNTAASSIEEFIQEFSQAVGEDITAKFAYDPERELNVKDWLKQGAIGGLVGGAAGGITSGLSSGGVQLDQPAAAERERMVIAAIDERQRDIDKALGGVPPDLVAPEVADPMTGSPEGEAQIAPGLTVQVAPAIETPEFKQWFGDSKVVEPETGAPLVVYHGTNENFTSFDPDMRGTNSDHPTANLGFFFTADESVSQIFGDTAMPVFLTIANPLVVEGETFARMASQDRRYADIAKDVTALKSKAVAAGHDGIRITPVANAEGASAEWAADTYVAFEPTQIKSVNNRGTFDPNNPDILAQRAEGGAANQTIQRFRGGTMPATRPDGKIELTHWSRSALDVIDPARRGTGPLRGGERARLVGPDAVDRSYYGVGDPDFMKKLLAENKKLKPKDRKFHGPTDPYRNEGLGPYRHTVAVDPNDLYNWYEDPAGLKAGLDRSLSGPEQVTQYEKLIKDAGWRGIYMNSSPLGQTAVLFDQAQPERVLNETTGEEVDAARELLDATVVSEADTKRLPGLPANSTGPVVSVVRAARAYAESIGIPVRRQQEYVRVDEDRARRIAQAYEDMPHNPEDPAVKAAYQAMIDETLAQYQFVKASGLDIDFIEDGADPYPGGPKEVLDDLARGHLWVFPTDQGFGSLSEAEASNPLLAPTDEYVKGRRLLANDVFRIVHDFFGHGIEGSGFGARGEENAWQSHMRLYTEAALPAVTSETRGQNSWVNYGPHGEANRANQRETVYADQKTGIMPEWTWREGVADDAAFEIEAARGTTAANRNTFKAEQQRPAGGIPLPPDAKPAEVSLAKLANNVIKTLDLTTRQGRFTLKGSDVMGQYSRKQAVVRLRTWNDLSSLVHEGGHALHDAASAQLKTFERTYEADLKKIADDLYGGNTAQLNSDQHVREGFAEFFRIFVLNRKYAATKYPTVTTAFEAELGRFDPQMRDALNGIGDQFAAWLQMPSAQLLNNMVVPGVRNTGIDAAIEELRAAGFKSWFQEYARKAVEVTTNQFAPLNTVVDQILNNAQTATGKAIDLKVADDPRKIARLARNAGARAMVQLTDGVMPYRSVQSVSRGLREALMLSQGVPDGQSPRRIDEARALDFDSYLVALRAKDEYRRLDEGKIDRPPLNATLGDVTQAIADLEAKYGQSFLDAAAVVHEYGMALWKKQYEAGLMDRETYLEGLDRQFYAPLQRDMSDKKASLGVSALTGGSSIVKRFRGSDRDIVSPMSVLMHKTFALEQIIAQNDVKKALALLADKAGAQGALVERIPASTLIGKQYSVKEVAKQLTNDDDIGATEAADLVTILQASIDNENVLTFFRAEQATTKGENITFFWESGKLQAIQVVDGDLGSDLINLMDGVGRENFQFGVELLTMTSTAFRTAITSWPDFLIVNYIRDQLSAWVLTDVGFKPFATGIQGIGDELRQNRWSKMYNASMGIMGGMNVAALHEARIKRDIEALRGKGYLAQAFNERGVLGAVKGMAKVVELTETGTRLGLFRNAFERGKADGLTDWEAAMEAAYIATDYIDFGLNGNRMLLARRTIPFLNAQLQGLYKMLRTLGGDEVRQRKGLRFVLGAYFKSTRNMELSRTEKMAINTGRKAWVKMVGLGLLSAALHFLFQDDPDYQEASEYMRVTGWVIPIGDGRIFYIPKPFELALIANAVERGLESAAGDDEAKNRFMRGLAMTLTPPTSPPALQIAVEQAANYDFFGGREIVPDYMRALSPELQYNNYTSELAKEIGAVTGWSPMRIDHFLSGIGASAYRDVVTMTNALDPNRPSMDATDAPILRRFVRDVRRGSTSAQDFWKQASMQTGRLREAELSYKTLLEGGNEPAANKILSTFTEDEQAYALLNTHFKSEAKKLNPFYRGRQITTIVSAMRREMVSDLGIENTGPAGEPIKLTASQKAQVDEALSEYARREIRNTLIVQQAPGWAGKRRANVDKTLDMIETLSPEVREEISRRLVKAKVYSADVVFEYWPEVKDRLLKDRDAAFLNDIVSIAKAMQ